ncbi:hypothetical protein BH10ACT1_BH10ACT1_39890 [soil metagenome]
MRRPFILLAAALVLLGACGASDSDGAASTTTGAASTTSEATTTSTAVPATTTTGARTTTAAEGPVAEGPTCTAYFEIVNLYASLEPIATGSNDAQVQAQDKWDAAVAELQASGPDAATAGALESLSRLTFTVTEDATGAPTEGELVDAFAVLDSTYAKGCGSADLPTECPAPETLEAEGYTCDSEGNLTPIPQSSGGKVEECPAPEVLEAEGYTCDSEGNLTPVG